MLRVSRLFCFTIGLIVSSEPLYAQSLGEVVRYALVNYPTIAQAQATAAATDADLAKAYAAYWPTLGVETYGQNDYNRYQGNSKRPLFGVGPVARIPIYSFGRFEAEVDRQTALKSAAENKILSVRDDVAMAAAENYLTWARSLEMLKLARENLDEHLRIQKDTENIVESDPGRRFDLIQAETRVEGARLTVAQREAEVLQSAAHLSRFWPAPMPAVKSARPVGMDEFTREMPKSIESAIKQVETKHPYLEQLQQQVKAAEASVDGAKAQLNPSIGAQISSVNNGTAQLVLNVPLFDRTASAGSIKAAIANVGAAKLALDEGRILLRDKMLVAFVDYQTGEKRRKVSAEQADKGRQLLETYREQFIAGRRTLLDLLQIQNDYFSYRINTVQGVYDIRLARFRLMAAMGRLASSYEKTNAK